MAEAHLSTTRASAPVIQMLGVSKWFGDFRALNDVSLEVDQGEKIVICGPSGSGKSTLIRCINRLEPHDKGTIVVDGHELTNDLRQIETVRSEVGVAHAVGPKPAPLPPRTLSNHHRRHAPADAPGRPLAPGPPRR